MDEKIPPQSIEAEQAVLGAMMIDSNTISSVLELINEDSFYKDAHKKIFRTIVNLYDHHTMVDAVTLADELRRCNLLEEVGGKAYLEMILNGTYTAANAVYYANIVREKYILRSLISAATQIAGESYEGSEEVDTILDNAEQRIFNITQHRADRGFVHIKEIVSDSFEYIDKLYERGGGMTGVRTHFTDLDELTSGLHPSDLIIIAARPSIGKTALGLNIAGNVAINDKITTGIFSLEMSKEQVVIRMLCSEARVDGQKLRRGRLSEKEWPRLASAAERLAESPIFIDDTPSASVLEIRAKARRLKSEHKLGLIVIDYLQLIRSRGRAENREQEIAEISRSLKALAKELNIPVVALSQLNRAVELRSDKKPQLADLRESGAIEQDADVVILLSRPEFYEPNNPEVEGKAMVNVAKQRNGPVGEINLTFLKEYARFENYTPKNEYF
ncbi:MAG: replicative DNA helicase [bacterium]